MLFQEVHILLFFLPCDTLYTLDTLFAQKTKRKFMFGISSTYFSRRTSKVHLFNCDNVANFFE